MDSEMGSDSEDEYSSEDDTISDSEYAAQEAAVFALAEELASVPCLQTCCPQTPHPSSKAPTNLPSPSRRQPGLPSPACTPVLPQPDFLSFAARVCLRMSTNHASPGQFHSLIAGS